MLGFLFFHNSYGVFSRIGLIEILFWIWHAVFIASAQKILATLVSLIMVLAISCNVLFFRFTTPFCWGVLGQEKSCEIPFSLKNISSFLFSNSPPWSLLTLTILRSFSFWTWLQKVTNTECDSSLCLKNFTHVHLL